MAVDHRRQPLLEIEALAAHVLEEGRIGDDIDDGVADRHGQRIAAEGRAVGAGRHALGRLVGREARADREAAAEPLGERHDVRRGTRPFVGEQLAGAADAGLHLVVDEKQAVLVAERAQVAQELRRHQADAALALDRLDHDRGGLGADRRPSTALRSPSGTWTKPPGAGS